MAKGIVFNGENYEMVSNLPVPQPAPGHVVVNITLRPVNVMDPIFSPIVYQGVGKPIVPGFEGFGVVHSVGTGVTKFKEGQRVMPFLLHHGEQGNGSWQEYVDVDEDYVWPVPDSVADEVAAQLVINPWTAFGLIQELQVPKGEYLLQTAAASVLGRYVIVLAKHHFGIKTINIVRRKEQVEELKALGADEVICTSDATEVVARVKEITRNRGAYAGLDCIGGAATKPVISSVRDDGTVIIYGSMGGTFDASAGLPDLFRNVKLTGWTLLRFWDGRHHEYAREIGKLVEAKVLPVAVGDEKLPLANVNAAMERANSGPGGAGKILLTNDSKQGSGRILSSTG